MKKLICASLLAGLFALTPAAEAQEGPDRGPPVAVPEHTSPAAPPPHARHHHARHHHHKKHHHRENHRP